MNDLYYCQYAFVKPECRVAEIGPGVDPHYPVELIAVDRTAALVSRVGLVDFSPGRLEGKTPEDLQWLGGVAARHHEIICQASGSSPVLPLRLGTLFSSVDSLRASLSRCDAVVAEFLDRVGDRQEWGVKLYLQKRRLDAAATHNSPSTPHLSMPRSGAGYLARKKDEIDSRRLQRISVFEMVQTVEQCLTAKTEHCCRIRNLPSDLTGRPDEMVFNAACLLSSTEHADWMKTIQNLERDIQGKGLSLEISGPWPPYHFCPTLEM